MKRNYDFRYLTKNVGKGSKNPTCIMKVEEEENSKTVVYHDKDETEKYYQSSKKNHLSKVLQSKAHEDKTYENLNNNTKRDIILNRDLKVNGYDEVHWCNF